MHPDNRNSLTKVLKEPEAVLPKKATEFSGGCAGCAYAVHGCPVMKEWMAMDRDWRRCDEPSRGRRHPRHLVEELPCYDLNGARKTVSGWMGERAAASEGPFEGLGFLAR